MIRKSILCLLVVCFGSLTVCAQRVILETVNGVAYAVITTEDMVRGSEVRRDNAKDFLVELDLYKKDELTPEKDASGNVIRVKRVRRHGASNSNPMINDIFNPGVNVVNPDYRISHKFAIAPADASINGDGQSASSMTWSNAAGLIATANTTTHTAVAAARNSGCAAYTGRNNEDPKGTWRLPTRKEVFAIVACLDEIEKLADKTGFKKMTNISRYYWLSTEYSNSNAFFMNTVYSTTHKTWGYAVLHISKATNRYARCVKDID